MIIMESNKDLNSKVEKVLTDLRKKQAESDEVIIDRFIKLYEEVLKTLNTKKGSELSKADFVAIKTLGRAYLETSSDYRQDFLFSMSDVEMAIKKYF